MEDHNLQKAHHMLLKADRMHRQLYNRMGQRLNVHRSQHMVLMYLSRPESTGSQKEIADIFEISPPAVAMLLKRLEKSGYIVRKSSAEDNRRNVICLTEKGQKVVSDTKVLAEECNRVAFAGISNDEMETLISLMAKIQNNLKKLSRG